MASSERYSAHHEHEDEIEDEEHTYKTKKAPLRGGA